MNFVEAVPVWNSNAFKASREGPKPAASDLLEPTNASASSINNNIPLCERFAHFTNLWISVTARAFNGATSPPLIIANSKPECLATRRATIVFPVPGGPWKRMWRSGAPCLVVSSIDETKVRTRMSSSGFKTTPCKTLSVAVLCFFKNFSCKKWPIRVKTPNIRDVSRTNAGCSYNHSFKRSAKTLLISFAAYIPTKIALIATTNAVSRSGSAKSWSIELAIASTASRHFRRSWRPCSRNSRVRTSSFSRSCFAANSAWIRAASFLLSISACFFISDKSDSVLKRNVSWYSSFSLFSRAPCSVMLALFLNRSPSSLRDCIIL